MLFLLSYVEILGFKVKKSEYCKFFYFEKVTREIRDVFGPNGRGDARVQGP